jgi:predicted transcriptional regulator
MQDKRLADILIQLGLTSRHLAEILNVHYSLVSKWLNKKRPLKYNSPHLKNLVSALISLENARKSMTVKTILREAYPDADLSTSEKIAVYLNNYLASDNSENFDQDPIDTVDPRHVFAKAKVDIYQKNTGRRDALMRLLDTAITLAPGQELLLFSEESLVWHIDDENFRREWLEKYMKILHLGIHVTMIHTVDRQENHLLHTITQWLPLHLTGKTRAFYYPEYSNSLFKPSISILRNQAVMSGMTVVDFSNVLYTYYSSSPCLVKHFELLFEGLLAGSRPLFEKLGEGNITRNILNAARHRNNVCNFSDLPLEMALSYEDFCEVLRENAVIGEKYTHCAGFFLEYGKLLQDTMAASSMKQILDFAVLEEGLHEGAVISEFNWITGGNLFVSPAYLKRALLGLVRRLAERPNFSLALIDDYALPHLRNVSLLVKENTIVVANSRTEKTPCPLIMKEPTIVRTFFKYFTCYWDSIPRIQRDRENVIRRLEQLAE